MIEKQGSPSEVVACSFADRLISWNVAGSKGTGFPGPPGINDRIYMVVQGS